MHEKRRSNRWKEPPWTACRASKRRSARAALALGRQSMRSRCRAPEVSRSPPAVTADAAPAGPRTCRPRAPDEARAVAAARRATAPGSGQSRANSPAWRDRMGWGWETNAMRCECKGSDTGRQRSIPVGEQALATLGNLYLQPASDAGRFICRCSSASLHSAAGPLRGHRPVEAPSALHHLFCRTSFDTWRHASTTLSSSFERPPVDYPGKL